MDPSLAEKQRMLKKARLADQLNDQLSHRPGPLELIKKNILHTEEDIETAVKSGSLAFKATCEGASGRPEHPVAYCGPPEEISPSPSPPSTLSPVSISVASPRDHPQIQHPAPGKTKPPKKNKCKAHHQPKARFKFHEYKGPPNAQKASTPPGETETPYELLLQQQQLLLQLMLPASPAPSSASIASDSSDYAPPPPPLPPTHHVAGNARIEDMKVSDLRAECKRRNLRVSGPKPTLIDRLRPFLVLDRSGQQDDSPRSPASVASNVSVASPEPVLKIEYEPAEDIVQSQRRQIEELERKLEASRQQLEAVRREAAGAAASDQSRRLLQAHLCVSQLRAQLDALQQAPHPPPPQPQRYVIAASTDAAPDRLVRLFTVTPPTQTSTDANNDAQKTNPAYILNGVKVVPIAILPTAHYEPAVAPPPPPPPPPPPMPEITIPAPSHDSAEDSQIMDDVLEILVENGELPPSAVQHATPNATIDSGFSEADTFSPADVLSPTDVLTDDVLSNSHVRDSLAADELQRELDDIQNEIMSHADMHANNRATNPPAPDLDPDLSVDLLSNGDFHTDFGPSSNTADNDDFFERFFSGHSDRVDNSPPMAMDIGEDTTDKMPMTPLTNGDILEHTGTGFDYSDDLSLPSFQSDDTRHGGFDRQDFDLQDMVNDTISNNNMNVDSDAYDYSMETDMFPNIFGRGHVPQCDPLLGGVLPRPAPRPALKHYSWDKIEYDAT